MAQKTIRQALEMLSEPTRTLAINNCIRNNPPNYIDKESCFFYLGGTIRGAFLFDETPEGSDFWHSIVYNIENVEI